jgi:hypothetical protein
MSMTRVAASVDIKASLESVWAYASDWRYWDEWWDSASGFRPTTQATRGNGARYAYRAWVAGLTLNLEAEIHDFVEKVGWRAVGTKGVPHRTQWVFETAGGMTRLTYILEYSLPVPVLGGLLDRMLMRSGWQRRLEASLGNLKRHFEAGQETALRAGAGAER